MYMILHNGPIADKGTVLFLSVIYPRKQGSINKKSKQKTEKKKAKIDQITLTEPIFRITMGITDADR